MTRRREPYARLEKLVGRVAVFLVKSRTDRRQTYRVTVTPLAYAGEEEVVSCNCLAGSHRALCFHGRRALASYRQRALGDTKGRHPVILR